MPELIGKGDSLLTKNVPGALLGEHANPRIVFLLIIKLNRGFRLKATLEQERHAVIYYNQRFLGSPVVI